MSFTVGLFGDVMLGRRVGRRLSRRSPEELWSPEVRDLASECDFVLANLECCVSNRGRRTQRIPAKRYFFRAPREGIGTLQAIGASAVGLANNHAFDFEGEAFDDTLAHLADAGIAVVGAGRDAKEARRGAILNGDGHRLGVVGASDHPVAYAAIDSTPGIAYVRRGLEPPSWLLEEIARLRAECDRVIAFMHWGPNRAVGPAPWQHRMATQLQAAGADLVAGHSAHVFHGTGWTARGPILFDLGDALDDYQAMYGALRNELGLFARWRPGDREAELELIGLRLQHCFTGLAGGADADWISARLERACGALGVRVERVSEARFRLSPASDPMESDETGSRTWPQPKARVGSRRVLWTADAVLEITGGERVGPAVPWQATDVAFRASTIRPGYLFAATNAPYTNGHEDVPKAFERGAVAALVARVPDGLPDAAQLILVDNTMTALRRLARVARERCDAKTIAVTGSAGKTSVTEALHFALRQQARTYVCRTNENDDQGAAVSVARLSEGVKYAVFELCIVQRRLAMTGVARKSRWVRPDVAVITTIGRAHLPFYDTLENIADAKAGIFHGLREGGTAILPRDDPLFERLERRARRYGVERIVTFGRHPDAEVRLDDLNLTRRGSEVFANVHGRELDYKLRRLGRHQAINSLAVLAAVAAIGADPQRAASALSRLLDSRGRGRRHSVTRPGGTVEVIDQSFSSVSMRPAIEILGAIPIDDGGRRIAVLGDLAGTTAERTYVEIGLELLAQDIDLVYTAGEASVALREVLPAGRLGAHAESSEKLAPVVVADVRAGDTVLVKGGSKMRMVRVVGALLRSKNSEA